MGSINHTPFRNRLWGISASIWLSVWMCLGFQAEKQSRQPEDAPKNHSPVVRTLPAGTSRSTQQNEFQRLLEEGKRLFEEEMDFDGALSKYQQAADLASTPLQRSQVYFSMSLVYFASAREDDLPRFQNALSKLFESDYDFTPDEAFCPPKYMEYFRRIQARYGALSIRSDPSGAEVYLNDAPNPIGTTPLTVGLMKGAVRLRIKRGKREKKDLLNVVAGKKLKIPVYRMKGRSPLPYILGGVAAAGGIGAALLLKGKAGTQTNGASPNTGSIQILSTPNGAKIFLDGSDTGQSTNFTLDGITPGSHIIKLIKEGYLDHQENVSVAAGGTAVLNVTLTAHRITVSLPDSSTVWTTGAEGQIRWQTSSESSGVGNNVLRTASNAPHQYLARSRVWGRAGGRISATHRSTGFQANRTHARLSAPSRIISPKMTAPLVFNNPGANNAFDCPPVSAGAAGTLISPKDHRNAPGASPRIVPLPPGLSGKAPVQTISEIKIDLYRGASLLTPIAANTSNSGSYSWTVDTTLATGSNYKVRVSSLSNPDIYGESVDFTIQKQTTNNLAPNPSFENGTEFPSSWVSTISNGLADVTWSTQKSHHGSRSIRVANPQCADLSYAASMGVETSNFINVDNSRIYDFTAWYLYEQKPGPASSSQVLIFVDEYDAAGKWLQAYGYTGHGSDAQGNIWYQFSWSRVLNSQTAKIKLSVVYLCEEKQENTVVYFDDLSFTRR